MDEQDTRKVLDVASVGRLDYAKGDPPRRTRFNPYQFGLWLGGAAVVCPLITFMIRAVAGPSAAVLILWFLGLGLLAGTALAAAIAWVVEMPVRPLASRLMWAVLLNAIADVLLVYVLPFGRSVF